MSVKDTLVGTAKQFVAEIVGDGRLANEGSAQAGGSRLETIDAANEVPRETPMLQPDEQPVPPEVPHPDENRFTALLGNAALAVWADLPRDAQERLFAAAAADREIANALASFLHDRHPRTAHPPRPTGPAYATIPRDKIQMSINPQKRDIAEAFENGTRRATRDRQGRRQDRRQDHDLVHAEGGTLGLGKGKDLNHDD
ncbi:MULTISPECIES: hypothetical protein [unclassified Bradyrhizobium]